MTTAAPTHEFTSQITGKGLTPNGAPYLQFNWMLPDSKYPFQMLLGREQQIYDAWNVGDAAVVTIVRGGLKTDKDGSYQTDYFWNYGGMQVASPGAEETPQQRTQEQGGGDDQQPNPQALGMCQNNAVYLISAGFIPLGDDETIAQAVLHLRDVLYAGVTAIPYRNPLPIEPGQHPRSLFEEPAATRPAPQAAPLDSPGNGPPSMEPAAEGPDDGLPF